MAIKSKALVEAETKMLRDAAPAFVKRMYERLACKTDAQRKAYIKRNS